MKFSSVDSRRTRATTIEINEQRLLTIFLVTIEQWIHYKTMHHMNSVHKITMVSNDGPTKAAFYKKGRKSNKSLVKQEKCLRVTQVNPEGPPRNLGAHPNSHDGSTPQYFRRKKYRSSSEYQGMFSQLRSNNSSDDGMMRCISKGRTGGKNKISGGERVGRAFWEERGGRREWRREVGRINKGSLANQAGGSD